MNAMSILRYCFPTFVRIAEWASSHFTHGGLAILIAMLACLPVVIYTETPLFHIFSSFFSLLVVAGGIGYLWKPRFTVQTKAPHAVPRDQSFPLEITLENIAWTPAFDLEIGLKPHDGKHWRVAQGASYLPYIARHETATVSLPLVPLQRGVWKWPALQITSTFPLNLIYQRRTCHVSGELVVFPHYEPRDIDHLLEGHAAGDAFEWETESQTAGDTIFSGNREYVPGMSVRRWDYASWARTGKPIVREITDPPQCSAGVWVDSTLEGNPTAHERTAFEAMLSVAAGLVDRLLREEWTLHTFQLGMERLESAAQSQSIALEAVLEALARTTGTSSTLFRNWENSIESIDSQSVLYLVFSRWDRAREAFCRRLESEQISWRAWIIHDNTISVPADLASQVRFISPNSIAK
jgi:uncharacterized protein (DUF58 family)